MASSGIQAKPFTRIEMIGQARGIIVMPDLPWPNHSFLIHHGRVTYSTVQRFIEVLRDAYRGNGGGTAFISLSRIVNSVYPLGKEGYKFGVMLPIRRGWDERVAIAEIPLPTSLSVRLELIPVHLIGPSERRLTPSSLDFQAYRQSGFYTHHQPQVWPPVLARRLLLYKQRY